MTGPPPVAIPAPAKLNLFLEVLGRRPDGFHEIETVLAEIPWADSVRLEARDRPGVELDVRVEGIPDSGIPRGRENLAVRAAEAVLAAGGGGGGGLRVGLVKRIPPGAGLGGGSSDAAAVLRAAGRWGARALREARLAGLAEALGSDVPFFLRGGAALARGRGEILEPLEAAPLPPLLLAWPGVPLGTAAVYARCRPPGEGEAREAGAVREALRSGDADALEAACANRLLTAAEEAWPPLRDLRRRLSEAAGRRFHLTGSGSALFAFAPRGGDPEGMRPAVEGILREFPGAVVHCSPCPSR